MILVNYLFHFFVLPQILKQGKQVMLDKGQFSPIYYGKWCVAFDISTCNVINDQILIDGGVVNNYPIDELRAKGMDVIIGVDVQDELVNREKLISAPDVLLQINNFRTIKDMKLKANKTDIYIKPDIKDFNVVSFNEGI